MKRNILCTILCLLTIHVASAQNYIVNCQVTDHVAARPYSNGTVDPNHENDIQIANGEEVVVVGIAKEPAKGAEIKKDGKRYLVNAQHLAFSKNNPASTMDILADLKLCPNSMIKDADGEDMSWNPQSDFGKMLYSGKLPITATVLVLGAFLMVLFAGCTRSDFFRVITISVVPVLLLGAVACELYYFYYMGDECIWWINPAYQGVDTAIWRCVPVMLVVVLQWIIIWRYKDLFKNAADISYKPIIWSLILFLPAAIVVTIIVGVLENSHTLSANSPLDSILIFGLLIAAVLYAAYRNTKAIGFVGGLMFTLFFLIYTVGAVVTVFAFVYTVMHIIWALLVMLFNAVGVYVAIFVFGKMDIFATKNRLYPDLHGGVHKTELAAQQANARYAHQNKK